MIDSPIALEYLETGRCESCRVIDLHAHYGHYAGIYMPNHTPEAMIATMDRCGVETIVSAGHTALRDMVLGNAEMAQVTAAYPGRWYAYLTYNPHYPKEGRQQLEGYESQPTYVGLKFHPSHHEYPITGDLYRPALEFAASRQLLVLTHTWGGSAYDRPELLAQVAERYPEAVFLAGHSGHGQFAECIQVAREHANVYLELTAAYAVNGVIEEMVARVGAHKIVFGCDLPWFDPHYAIGCLVMAHISDDARRAILRENALRLLESRRRI
ncbi:MAG: amidohydrolase family protein [Anaerolineae bacterium]|nr:amidohydrolase family protein [Anaerolineae bacterium]